MLPARAADVQHPSLDRARRREELQAMITSETIPAGPLEFHCLTAGKREDPLLLFLHGFPEYSGAWEEMLDRLSDQFFCVAPDQRGYGRSSKPEGVANYAAGRLAGDAAAVLTHFAPRARAVIGHDWGASVAYALAMARPELMEKLVILNGAHPIPFQKALAAGGAQSQASQYIHYLRREGRRSGFQPMVSRSCFRFSLRGWILPGSLARAKRLILRPGGAKGR